MASPKLHRLVLRVACLLFSAPCVIAYAVPLAANETTIPSPTRHRVSDAEVLDGPPTNAEHAQIRPLGDPSLHSQGMRSASHPSGLGTPQELGGLASDGLSSGVVDALRPLLNLNPRPSEQVGNAASRPNRSGEQDLVLSGTGLQDLVDDTIRSIVNSAVELRVDDQGRASFSLMGLGDFGIMVSGDRNEVALVSGADVLFTAHRNPYPQPGGYGGAVPDYGPSGLAPASRPVDTRGESPLHQAMELLSEIATHPLSLLVYVIVGAYILLWNVLAAQRQSRPPPAAAFARSEPPPQMHRSSRRHRSRRARRH